MNTTSYDQGTLLADLTPPGERIPGPPSAGGVVIGIGWLLAAAVLVLFGGMIFFGILDSVS